MRNRDSEWGLSFDTRGQENERSNLPGVNYIGAPAYLIVAGHPSDQGIDADASTGVARKLRNTKGSRIEAQCKSIVEPLAGQIKEARGLHRRAAPHRFSSGMPFAWEDGQPSYGPQPPRGIHLKHELALGRPGHGRIAGLPGDAIETEGKEGRADAQPRRCEGHFAAGMAAVHHDQLKFCGGNLVRRLACRSWFAAGWGGGRRHVGSHWPTARSLPAPSPNQFLSQCYS